MSDKKLTKGQRQYATSYVEGRVYGDTAFDSVTQKSALEIHKTANSGNHAISTGFRNGYADGAKENADNHAGNIKRLTEFDKHFKPKK